MVHRHAPGALAMGAFAVRWVERLHVGGRKLQLRDVALEQHEMVLAQQDPMRETQPLDLALASPRAEVSDRDRRGLGSLGALGAEEVQVCILAQSPALVTHDTLQGTPSGISYCSGCA